MVERHFRTLDSLVFNSLPGTTHGSPAERDAEALEQLKTGLTLDQVWNIACRALLDVYHIRHHKGLRAAPLDIYYESLAANPEYPEPAEEMVASALGWCGVRRLNQLGIRVDDVHYRSEATAEVFQRTGEPVDVAVARSPLDLTRVVFQDPLTGEWREAPVAAADYDAVAGRTPEEFAEARAERRARSLSPERRAEVVANHAALDDDIEEMRLAFGAQRRTKEQAERARSGLTRRTASALSRTSNLSASMAGAQGTSFLEPFPVDPAPQPAAEGRLLAPSDGPDRDDPAPDGNRPTRRLDEDQAAYLARHKLVED
ncbi:MAG: hypothetical protein K2X11_08360 [Acetobacteraceae bacterium]|nr:hypothetical protein [Acetobacteraceae bacterium]